MNILLLVVAALSVCVFLAAVFASAWQGYTIRQCIADGLLLASLWPLVLGFWLYRSMRGES